MADPVHIFISYRHQEPDRTLAHTFADALGKAGQEVFIDTGIRWGKDWVKKIREALEKTNYLLVLLSREAANSEMVVEEVMIARELAQQRNGVPIILPIRINLPFSEPLPYHLSAYLRTIQQERWNGEDDTSRLTDQLLHILAEQAGWTDGEHDEASGGVRQEAPQPYFDPRDLLIPGGALEVDTSLYIMRDADEEVLSAVRRKRALVTVRGPRQTGKTSLIMRVYAAMRGSSEEESQLRTAFIDFQALPHDDFQTLDTIWRTMAENIAYQLSLDHWDASHWKPNANYDQNFSRFLDHFVFKENKTPVLICLDEVDRLFKTPIKSDFFSSVRAFYNRGAFDPVWQKVRWLLATSSEPSFFIEDLTQSPFNIGLRVELNTFNPDEVKKLAAHHGLKTDPAALDEMVDYVGGHPYLTHRLVYQLAQEPASRDQLFDAKTAGGGVFREHLHRFLIQFQEEEVLVRAMRRIISGKGYDDVRIAHRLEAAGLVRHDENQKVVPLCQLYADFFGKELA